MPINWATIGESLLGPLYRVLPDALVDTYRILGPGK